MTGASVVGLKGSTAEATSEKATPFMRIRLARNVLSPIGTKADGSPIWPFFGAQPEGDGDGGDGDGDGGDGNSDDGDGDPGDGNGASGESLEAQLAAEKKANERLRKSLKPFSALRRSTGLSVEEMQARLSGGGGSNGSNSNSTNSNSNSGQGQPPVDVDAIRREERLKERERYEKGIRSSAVEAVATSLLEDPDDAARFLDLSSYEVDDDGKVDKRQIRSDLERLIGQRPYLAKVKKAPDFEGGSRGSGAPKGGMSDVIRRQAGIIR